MAEDRSVSIEVVYRGIFQKTLAQRICWSIVLAARKRGHTGTAFARYGDSPERNGVPAKQFAVVAVDQLSVEGLTAEDDPAGAARAAPACDATRQGVRPWARVAAPPG